jgi:hypothetical protein
MNQETTTSLIDTALASGSATALDPEERKLQELVLAVRDDAPSPDAAFELRMNARVAAGFPSSRRRLHMPAFAMKRPQLTALGAAASILIALVVVVSIGNGPIDREAPALDGTEEVQVDSAGGATGGSAESAPVAPAQESAPQESLAGQEPAASSDRAVAPSDSVIAPSPIPPPPGGGFVGGRERRVEQSAALVLTAPNDDISDLGGQVIAVTDRYRGIVMRSSVTTADPENAATTGYFDLRIPVRNLRSALRDLSGLADVASRTENADDVTASFVSARTRLQELNAERRGLLRRLERADTEQAAAAIRARMRLVNDQIDAQTRALAEMRRRTSYATVNVTLQPKQDDGAGGGISDGARDLRDSLIDAANLGLRVLGVAIPIGLVAGLLWISAGRVTRRRREAALD